VGKALFVLVLFFGTEWLAVREVVRIRPLPDLSVAERAEVMACLRAGLDRRPSTLRLHELARPSAGLVATVYLEGRIAVRVESRRSQLEEAVEEVSRLLAAAQLSDEVRGRARIKVDRIIGRAPLRTFFEPLFAFGIVPGIDGVELEFDGQRTLMLPDDLLAADLFSGYRPVGGLLDFEIGVDTRALLDRLAKEVGATRETWAGKTHRLYRLRTEGFIEPARRPGAPLPIFRGHSPGTMPTRARLLEAARRGGDYLLRHLGADGRFEYEYDTLHDTNIESDGYSLPRHAGASYFLAQLFGQTKDAEIRAGLERALSFLERQKPAGCVSDDRRCIGDPEAQVVDLGSSGLGLVAVAEYERVTGDHRWAPLARALARFIIGMQKESGDFCHLYFPSEKRRDEQTKLLYYSGEAALGLAKLLTVSGESHNEWDGALVSALASALDRALNYLTGAAYGHLAGQFYFGEDHWTCMAVEAGWDFLPPAHRERYARFCDQFAAFLRRGQYTADEEMVGQWPDLRGAYGLSPLLAPHPTPVGSRSETTISIYALDLRRGFAPESPAVEATRRQIAEGMRFLLEHQIDEDDAYLMPNPQAAMGGLLMSDVKRFIRIDFIQHACSAMLRAASLF
jgi:hypothetical protein